MRGKFCFIEFWKHTHLLTECDVRVINQSIIIWTLKTKSLLPSLYKREELPLFAKEGRPACAKPLRRRQGGDFLKHMSSLF
jgi:hypothetical protein